MSINKTRSFLYLLGRVLGDVNAVQKGRAAGIGLGKLFK